MTNKNKDMHPKPLDPAEHLEMLLEKALTNLNRET